MAINFGLTGQDDPNQFDYLKSLQVLGNAQTQKQAVAESQQKLATQRQVQASRGATSQLLASGDYSGAQQNALAAGDFDYATPIAKLGDDHLKTASDQADAIASTAYNVKQAGPNPQARAAAFEASVGALKAKGITDPEIAQARQDLTANGWSDQVLNGYAAAHTAAKDQVTQEMDRRKQAFEENKVTYVPVPQGGFLQGTKPDGELYQGGGATPAPTGAPAPQAGPADARSLYFNGIKPQESGGQPNGGAGAIGQPTPYGTAQGSSQMLPATAQATAQKLGIPWRPDLMTGKTPEALHYQDQLGVGYTQEALDASGGDPKGAAAYYFGGPNPQMHGPKTAQYAEAVIGRMGGPGVPQTASDAQPGAQPGLQPGGGQVQGGRINGNPKPTYSLLTPQQAQQHGLDPKTTWQISPDGQIAALPAKGDKPLTESQGKATSYYARAMLAQQQLAAVGKVPPPGAVAQALDEVPLGIGQHAISDPDQQQLTARRAFIAAVLRQESGAAISQGEFNSYNKLYFPQTGDTRTVRSNKAALRQTAVDSLKIEAGPGADQLGGSAPASSSKPLPAGWTVRVVR